MKTLQELQEIRERTKAALVNRKVCGANARACLRRYGVYVGKQQDNTR